MEAHYIWKTKLFSSKYEIFRNETPVGEFTDKTWSRTAIGELNNRKITFVTKGFFKNDTRIINSSDDSEIGNIRYNTWKTKATILLGNKEYSFAFDNLFHTKWIVSNENGPLIKYQSGYSNHSIDAYTDDDVLILTGLFIRQLFKRNAEASASAAT